MTRFPLPVSPLAAAMLVVVGLAPAPHAHAAPEAPTPIVESVTSTGYRVRVPIGDPVVTRGTVFGFDLAEIDLPGADPEAAPGALPLPVRVLLLRVPEGVAATVAGAPGLPRSLGFLRPAPFAGLLRERHSRRAIDAATISAALSAPPYTAARGARAPVAAMVSSRDVRAGGTRLLAVSLRPVAWDPATGEATVVNEIVLEVRWDRPAEPAGAAPGRDGLAPSSAVGPRFTARAPGTAPAVPLRRSGVRLASVGPARVEPTRPWVRVGVLKQGIYQLTPADLASAGVSIGAIDPATFRLFRATPGDIPESVDVDLGPDSLRECAIDVTGSGDGIFDPADRIYFYATGATGFGHDLALGGSAEYQEAQHSDQETLWLTWGPGAGPTPPRRLATRNAAPVTPGATVFSKVTHRVHYENNRLDAFSLYRPPFRWERWFDRLFTETSRVPFILLLPGVDPGGAGDVRVRMWGRGNSIGAGIPDHVARIYWHKALVDTAGWNLSEPQDLTASGLTVATRDTLEIEVPLLLDPIFPEPTYPRDDQSYLAWFEVSYPRRLAVLNDTLQFAAPDSFAGPVHYTITQVADSALAWLLDRTDPESPVRLVSGAWTGSAPSLTLTVEDSLGPSRRPRYSLFSIARAARPPVIALYAPPASPRAISDLLDPGNGADYVIVVPPAFLAAAETLAVYREQRIHGLPSPRVRIATTDRIFAQFGSGRPSPTAIRNLMTYASRHWVAPAPMYLCLLGDATLDPKNYLGTGAPDWVPTYSNYFDPSTLSQFTSDDFYVLLDGPGDILSDVVVGRLPAGNGPEALALVTGKLRAYEAAQDFDSWRARALLCADDASEQEQPDPLGNDHVEQMERKDRLHIPYPVERNKVYLNDFAFADTTRQTKPAARAEFISQINRGAWFVDYIGHGSEDVLAHEQVFRLSDVVQLTNVSRPSIFGFFSCTVGKFDEPTGEGLGELLLTSPAGAVASIAASDGAFGSQSTPFNDSILDELFPLAPRVDSLRTAGFAYALAKNIRASPSNQSVRKYGFLGDPALTPPVPRGRGVWEKGPLDSLLRGDAALIRGHALMPDSTLDTLSTGTVELLIQGPPFVRTQVNKLTTARRNYLIPGPTIYRGPVTLDRGAFEARFVVPADGRLSGPGGKLQALLSAAGGRGVGLAVDSIRIAAGASTRTDGLPPDIRLFYAVGSDSTVRPGDRLTFEIEDSSGVDLTRLDNAHTIFVIVDDRGSPYELTQQFQYDAGSYTRGRVEFAVPALEAGPHVLEVHASDNFRNIAVRTFVIDMVTTSAATTALVLDQVFNYPNPFAQETYLHARLNQPARLTVRILTVAGRRLWETQIEGKAGQNYIPWNGTDSVGEKVAIGVYLFHVTAESPSGAKTSAIGRALRTK